MSGSRPKVLHAAHGYFPEGAGGVETYLRDVIGAQRARGTDARLLTGSLSRWPEVGLESLEVDGLPVTRLHRDDLYYDHFAKAWHPGVERLVGELLERERPDLLHVHQWIRLTCNLVEIAARRGIPSVVTLHDLYTSCPRCFRVRRDEVACFASLSVESCLGCVPRFGHESESELRASIELFHAQYRAELSMAQVVLAASEATGELVTSATGLPRERVEILPLAGASRFGDRAPPATELPAAGEPLRFGYWGNLASRKGVPVLVRAFRAAVEAGLAGPAELHLFGRFDTPELERELRALAAGLPIVFHGRFDYPQLAAARLHCAVFPMVCFETWGFVLDEAFELGLPAIVSDIGAIPRRAGAAALRVPPGDVAATASAIASLVDTPARLAELRAAVRRSALTLDGHVEALDACYARAIETGAGDLSLAVPSSRHAELLRLQRESAQARICPEGGPR